MCLFILRNALIWQPCFLLKADKKVKPTEHLWAVKYECAHVGEMKNEGVCE